MSQIPDGIVIRIKNDLFVDAQIANKFAKPPDVHFGQLIDWLLFNNKENPDENGGLILSNKIINEYFSGNRLSLCGTGIGVIVNKLIAQKRFNSIGNDVIKSFFNKHLAGRRKGISCNKEDKYHIPLVLLSNRKMGLIDDTELIKSIINYPKFKNIVRIERSPEKLDYK